MSISFKQALGPHEAALRLRSQRAEVLSSNLANADTPHYKARDFDFHAALRQQVSGAGHIHNTHAAHMPLPPPPGGRGELQYRTPTQPSLDGNTVDEHIEHAEFMANSLEFQTAFTLLNSRFKGLLSAIRGE